VDWLIDHWDRVVALAALAVGIFAVILHYRDRPQLRIGEITVQFDDKFVHSITVPLHNDGTRPAIGVTGILSLQRDRALPLHRQKRNGRADKSADWFDVPPQADITLIAAWGFLPDGGVDPANQHKPTHRFRDENFPIAVEITMGNKNVSRVMQQDEFIAINQAYLRKPATA
jgi:hypothetical protein